MVNVEIRDDTDRHFHFDPGNAQRKTDIEYTRDVKKISCCWNESDLCYIKEVEAENGQIMRHVGSGNSWVYEDVATHQQRYDLCQEHSDIIYCRKNPSGDALTPPPPPPSPPASVQDCFDNFEESPAADSCDNFRASNSDGMRGADEDARRRYELTNGMCQAIYADCPRNSPLGGNTDAGGDGNGDDLALADVVNIHWCEWTVEVHTWHPPHQAIL